MPTDFQVACLAGRHRQSATLTAPAVPSTGQADGSTHSAGSCGCRAGWLSARPTAPAVAGTCQAVGSTHSTGSCRNMPGSRQHSQHRQLQAQGRHSVPLDRMDGKPPPKTSEQLPFMNTPSEACAPIGGSPRSGSVTSVTQSRWLLARRLRANRTSATATVASPAHTHTRSDVGRVDGCWLQASAAGTKALQEQCQPQHVLKNARSATFGPGP